MENRMLTIQNNDYIASINLTGAELCSFYSIHSKTEYIWKGEGSVWGSTAPVLFPIIGVLKDGFFIYKGVKYFIPKHGFIRNNKDLKVEQHLSDQLTLSFQYSEETKKMFPFEFRFVITFRLIDNELEVSHKVYNLSSTEVMYFSVGGHPAFSCPFFENESYDDYFIEFEQTENSNRWNVLPDGTIHPISEDYLEDSSKINLTHSLFSKDALIFKDLKSKKVKLKSSKHLTSVELTFNDFEYLGIWAKPEGDFVCVEPWLGISDSSQSNHLIEEKEGIISLLPNNDFISNYKITIKEGTLS
jgi:galactose mutarotase-like enzyme